MFRFNYLVVGLLLFFSIQSAFAQAKNQPLSGQSFSGEITINATPDRVWEVLTDVAQLTEILGYEYMGGARKFADVGNRAAVKAWGDPGGFMLVRADQNKELRFNLDPENGSYICNCRWVLSKSGNGTRVWFEERYTESGPQSKEDLEAQVQDTNEKFKRLKMKAEKK
ncbi:MAG: SRPBCC family protein [bacterium]